MLTSPMHYCGQCRRAIRGRDCIIDEGEGRPPHHHHKRRQRRCRQGPPHPAPSSSPSCITPAPGKALCLRRRAAEQAGLAGGGRPGGRSHRRALRQRPSPAAAKASASPATMPGSGAPMGAPPGGWQGWASMPLPTPHWCCSSEPLPPPQPSTELVLLFFFFKLPSVSRRRFVA